MAVAAELATFLICLASEEAEANRIKGIVIVVIFKKDEKDEREDGRVISDS
jgi:hypothetical protein